MAAVLFRWNAAEETMKVSSRFRTLARKRFVDGEEYHLEVDEPRSAKEHAHFHAAIASGWENLPDAKKADYESPNHLRKRLLIICGYSKSTSTVFEGPNGEQHAVVAATLMRKLDEFAYVVVKGNVVKCWTALSTSKKSMKTEVFRQMKKDVLHQLDDILGTARGDVGRSVPR